MDNKLWRKEAKRRWGREAEWIQGDGQFALLAKCRVLTVTLWSTRTEAEKSKEEIDRTACGGGCFGASAHEIVDLSIARPSN